MCSLIGPPFSSFLFLDPKFINISEFLVLSEKFWAVLMMDSQAIYIHNIYTPIWFCDCHMSLDLPKVLCRTVSKLHSMFSLRANWGLLNFGMGHTKNSKKLAQLATKHWSYFFNLVATDSPQTLSKYVSEINKQPEGGRC